MRIAGGKHRGRVLASPRGLTTRPTSDRAREAIFNILQHSSRFSRPPLPNARVLDLFAGTGAIGLEALSQGARHAVFIERDRRAAAACRENIESLGLTGQCALLTFDALKPPVRPSYIEPRDLVFLDPPYGQDLGEKALLALLEKDWLADNAIAVFEMAKKTPETVPPPFIERDLRNYGVAQVRFIERAQAAEEEA
ncbi:MAG: 16S rRNA (guanine(966)-N(2))-methyltransferase RsmD [Alphaproteobacteria bacterium]|nr:16S rRNA (guanine(966)-N(2))-methyltransferase RsmD [Alphaproteobacteria bacterium]